MPWRTGFGVYIVMIVYMYNISFFLYIAINTALETLVGQDNNKKCPTIKRRGVGCVCEWNSYARFGEYESIEYWVKRLGKHNQN